MFGISLSELAVVFLVAIIFIKPKDIPEIIRVLKKLYKKILEFKTNLEPYYKDLINEVSQDTKYILDEKGIAHETFDISEWKNAKISNSISKSKIKKRNKSL